MASQEGKFKTSLSKDSWYPSWKSLFTQLSGGRGEVHKDLISEELSSVKSQLLQGYDIYKRKLDTKISNSGWALPYETEEVPSEEKKKKLSDSNILINKLSSAINLEENTCEKILISYFQFCFLGTTSDVSELLANTSAHQDALQEIITYYVHERSFLIKCWKLILNFTSDEQHIYHDICKNFVDTENPKVLYPFFLKQLESIQGNILSNEPHFCSELLKLWMSQCLHAQADILSCLIYVNTLRAASDIAYSDIQSIISLGKTTAFGKQCLHFGCVKSLHTQDWRSFVSYLYCIHLLQLILNNSINWTFPQFHELSDVIKSLSVEQNPVIGPIIYMAYLVFLMDMRYISDEDQLYNYSLEVFQLKPWRNMNIVLESYIVRIDKTFEKLVKHTVINFLVNAFEYFDVNMLDHESEQIFICLSQILPLKSFKDFIEDEGINKMIKYGLDTFPGKNAAILNLYSPLMAENKADCTKLLEELVNLKFFNWSTVTISMGDNGKYFYNDIQFSPFEFVPNVVIPRGTPCAQSDHQGYLKWSINIAIWDILKEELLAYCAVFSNVQSDNKTSYIISSEHFHVPRQKHILPSLQEMSNKDNLFRARVVSYLKLIAVIVKYPQLLDNNIEDVLQIVGQIVELNTNHPLCDFELVALCIDITRNMFPGVTNLFNQVTDMFPSLLPTPDTDTAYELISTGRFLSGNKLKWLLANAELTQGKFTYLKSYLDFLAKISDCHEANENPVYSSGVLFVTLEIFPHCLTSWIFQNEKHRHELCCLSLNIIRDFLNNYVSDKRRKYKPQGSNMSLPSYETVVKSIVLSILEGGCGSLMLDLTSLEEASVLSSFQETHLHGPTHVYKVTDVVDFSMAILCRALVLKSELINGSDQKSSLELSMFREQDKSKFIRRIIHNVHYSPRHSHRILSIKLLTRIAENKDISITIGSGLNSDTIRSIWLEPLFLQSESPEFKIVCLQFAVQCLQTQATLACHLLNAENIHNKENSLLAFVFDYLKNSDDVTAPLNYWVIAIVHTIWKQEMFLARQFFVCNSNFWKVLTAPLSAPFCAEVSNHIYSPIFNIISTELYWMCSDKDHPLLQIIDKFFQSEANVQQWSKLCTSVQPGILDNFGLFHELAVSWQEFIVIVCKYRGSACNRTVRNIIISDLLESLVEHLECMNDDCEEELKRPLHSLCNLTLIALNYWQGNHFDKLEHKLVSVCDIIIQLEKKYTHISLKTQILLLAVVTRILDVIPNCQTTEDISKLLRDNTPFLNSLSIIFSYVLDILENILCEKNFNHENTRLISVTIPLIIKVQSILGTDNLFWINNLVNENIFQKVYQCLMQSIKSKFYNDTSSFLLEYLIHCVLEEGYSRYLNTTNLASLIQEMVPESNLNLHKPSQAYLKNLQINYVYTEDEYNMFYSQFLNLLTVFLTREDRYLKKQVFNFVIINYDSLICLFKFCGLALTKKNLHFVISGLNLILVMLNHRTFFKEQTKEFFINIIHSISTCLGSAMNLLDSSELHIAQVIYPTEVLIDSLQHKLYNSKLKTDDEKQIYHNDLRLILLSIYKTCIAIFNKYNIEFGHVLTCVRIGYLPWQIQNVVPYVPLHKQVEPDVIPFSDFSIVIRCLKTYIKLLSKYNEQPSLLKEIKVNIEMTLHLLINHVLMFLLHPDMHINQKHVLLRDIETNLLYSMIDYIKKNDGVTILPFTKHWSKSPSKFHNYSRMKLPNIKLKLNQQHSQLTWGNKPQANKFARRITFGESNEASVNQVQHDIEYMQFMVQVFSQVCSLASSSI